MGLSEGELMKFGRGRTGRIPSISGNGGKRMALILPLPDTGPEGAAEQGDLPRPGFGNVLRKE